MFDPEFERRLTEQYGSREEQARKNRAHVDRLLTQISEADLRGILAALSRLKYPYCASQLSETDLVKTPLDQIIEPHSFMGLGFAIESAEDPAYVVSIGIAHGTVGDGGSFRVLRDGDAFRVDDTYEGDRWIC